METLLQTQFLGGVILRSYPTYKEWKLAFDPDKVDEPNSSYPTYKEWKLFNTVRIVYFVNCSYPTYKEWKLSDHCQPLISHSFVLILPIRNGNQVLQILCLSRH